jgi:hypothetical protein
MSPFVKPAVIACVLAAAGVGLSVSSPTHDAASATPTHDVTRPRLDPTSDVQARRMRRTLIGAEGSG